MKKQEKILAEQIFGDIELFFKEIGISAMCRTCEDGRALSAKYMAIKNKYIK